MKKFYYLFLITIIFTHDRSASAQPISFQEQLIVSGFDYAKAVVALPNGNFVVAGESGGALATNVSLVEFAPDGTVIRASVIPTNTNVSVRSMIYTSDDHYMITGSLMSSMNDPDWIVARVDTALDVVWLKTFGTPGSDHANNIFETPQGDLIVTGTTALGGSAKPSVVKLSTNGDILSEGYLNTNQFASPYYRGFYAGENRIAFARLANGISIVDTTGNVINDFPHRTGNYTEFISMLGSGSFVLVGQSGMGAPGTSQITFTVVDSSLSGATTNFRYSFGTSQFDPGGMLVDQDDNVIIFGNATPLGALSPQIMAMKLDTSGNILWANSFTPSGFAGPKINAATLTADGGFIVAGDVATALERMYVARFDSTGFNPCFLLSVPILTNPGSVIPASPHVNFAGNTTDLGNITIASIPGTAQATYICASTGINEQDEEVDVTITPTLVDDHFVITYDAPLTNLNLELIDVSGKLVIARQVNSGTRVSVEGLSAGMYFVRLSTPDGLFYQEKLVKD